MVQRFVPQPPREGAFRLSELMSALSYALDLTEGQPMGHAVQSCALGMKIAETVGLSPEENADLYYALLLKDAGCSSNASRLYRILGSDDRAAKRDVKTLDWSKVSLDTLRYLRKHVRPGRPAGERLFAVLEIAVKRDQQTMDLIQTRCERGADIARKMGFSSATAEAILSLDEMWNGQGYPRRLEGGQIPPLSQVMSLAQTLDVYNSMHGPAAAIEMAVSRSGKWFNPKLVEAVASWGDHDVIWRELDSEAARDRVHELAPSDDWVEPDGRRVDDICEAFASVIDAKSPFTYRHSMGVAEAALGIAGSMGLPAEDRKRLRRAALLHDIGKLSVSNSILEKPGQLDSDDWEVVRRHPLYTMRILEKASVFQDFAFVAAAHHEKLNGLGYHLSLSADEIPMEARILAVADIFDALAADRPYRDGLPLEKVLAIIGGDAPEALDPACFEALELWIDNAGWKESVEALAAVAPAPIETVEPEMEPAFDLESSIETGRVF